MRQTVTISLPDQLKRSVDRAVREGEYGSVSEFFRDLIRRRDEFEAIHEVYRSEREFRAGKGKALRSLRSLRRRA